MRSMVGGVEFRDMTGVLLGKIGVSDEVRFINRTEFGGLSTTMSDDDAERHGSSWVGLSVDGRHQIVSNLIHGNSKYSNLQKVIISADQSSTRIMGVDQAISQGSPSTPYLRVSTQGDIFTFREIESILTHENKHAQTRTISGITGFITTNEDSAYSEQVADPNFLSTHYRFRVQVANNWYYSSDKKWYRTKWSIANACGISVSDIHD